MKNIILFAALVAAISQMAMADELIYRTATSLDGQRVLQKFEQSRAALDGVFVGDNQNCSATLMQNSDQSFGEFIFRYRDSIYRMPILEDTVYRYIREEGQNPNELVKDIIIGKRYKATFYYESDKEYSVHLHQRRKLLVVCKGSL